MIMMMMSILADSTVYSKDHIIEREFVTFDFNIRKYSLGDFWAYFTSKAAD